MDYEEIPTIFSVYPQPGVVIYLWANGSNYLLTSGADSGRVIALGRLMGLLLEFLFCCN